MSMGLWRVLSQSGHREKGNQITHWFLATDGGCQSNSCAGTVYHS